MKALAVLILALVIAFAGIPLTSADEINSKWILGAWEGAHSGWAIKEDTARFEFWEQDGTIKWKMVRKGTFVAIYSAGSGRGRPRGLQGLQIPQ